MHSPAARSSMQRVRLPRASSKAYRHLKLQEKQQQAAAADEAAQQAVAESESVQQAAPEQQQAADNAQLIAALNAIKASDAGSLLEGAAAAAAAGSLRCGQLSTAHALPLSGCCCPALDC